METINAIITFLASYSVVTLASMVSVAVRVWVVIEVIKATSILNYIK